MIPIRLLTLLNRRYTGTIGLCYQIHTNTIQCHQSHLITDQHVNDSSLWFTAVPQQSMTAMIRSGKRKAKRAKPALMPSGPLLISCKNKALNHYKGMPTKKMAPVPLASKGWHSRKSNGDYFSILATSENTFVPLFEKGPGNENLEGVDYEANDFRSLGVNKQLVQILKNAGFYYPTVIQQQAISKIIAGKNLLVTGETGCGKTLVYLIPILEHLMRWKSKISLDYNSPLALIVVPSRELALQVGNVVSDLVKGLDITCRVVLSEHPKKFLVNFNETNLEKVDIVVSTLGVMCKFTYHEVYKLSKCLHVVLDEADTLLDDSFSMKMQTLLSRCRLRQNLLNDYEAPKGAQLTLVSATIPREVETTLKHLLPLGSLERIRTKFLHKIPPHIRQNFIRCKKSDKPQKILELVRREEEKKRPVIIFSNKTETCNWLAHFFRENGIVCARLNKKMNTEERVIELSGFRDGLVNVLTCTDLCSRGHDIPRVKHVVNYEFPNYMADYVHRCGRTGRKGYNEDCEVTSFISHVREVPLLNKIELSARTYKELEGVDNNIKRIICKKANPIKII